MHDLVAAGVIKFATEGATYDQVVCIFRQSSIFVSTLAHIRASMQKGHETHGAYDPPCEANDDIPF